MCITNFGLLNGLIGIFGAAFKDASEKAFVKEAAQQSVQPSPRSTFSSFRSNRQQQQQQQQVKEQRQVNSLTAESAMEVVENGVEPADTSCRIEPPPTPSMVNLITVMMTAKLSVSASPSSSDTSRRRQSNADDPMPFTPFTNHSSHSLSLRNDLAEEKVEDSNPREVVSLHGINLQITTTGLDEATTVTGNEVNQKSERRKSISALKEEFERIRSSLDAAIVRLSQLEDEED